MRRGRTSRGVGVVVAVSAVLAPLAFAGGGGTKVESNSFRVKAGAVGTGKVECPKGTEASGGGSAYFPLSAADNTWRDNSSFPSASRTWTAQFVNHDETDHDAKAFVVCRKGDDLFRRSQEELVSTQYNTTIAACPHGSSATGGGGDVSGGVSEMHLVESRPEGSRGWLIETFTHSGYSGSQEAFVICDPKNSHDYGTVSDTTTVPARSARRGTVQSVQAKAKCPDGSVATGGGYGRETDEINYAVADNRPKGERTWLLNARTYYPYMGFTAYARCLLG